MKGLKIVHNPNNGFTVATLHYTANPEKATPEWKARTKKGMPEHGWQREYEIDYGAMGGQLIFPQFREFEHKIVCEPFDVTHFRKYGSIDYGGARSPFSFHVYAIDYDDRKYAIWEHYGIDPHLRNHAEAIKESPYFKELEYIMIDPACNAKLPQSEKGPRSIVELLQEYEIYTLLGNNNREAGRQRIADCWYNLDEEEPWFYIWSCNPNMIREYKNLRWPEELKDDVVGDDHAYDECRYFFMSRPQSSFKEEKVKITAADRVYNRILKRKSRKIAI